MSGELQNWLSNMESWSTIIRNFGLVIAAVIALWFAKQRKHRQFANLMQLKFMEGTGDLGTASGSTGPRNATTPWPSYSAATQPQCGSWPSIGLTCGLGRT